MRLGSDDITLMLGDTEVSRAYLGSTQVYSAVPLEPVTITRRVVHNNDSGTLAHFASYWGGGGGEPFYWQDGQQRALTQVIRFTDIGVPQGATVVDARLSVWSRATWHGFTNADYNDFAVEQVDNASRVTSYSAGNSRRNNVGDSIRWPIPNVSGNTQVTSPNLASIVQGVINRFGWEAGNAIQFFGEASQDPNANTIDPAAQSYGANQGADSIPMLEITYLEQAPPAPVEATITSTVNTYNDAASIVRGANYRGSAGGADFIYWHTRSDNASLNTNLRFANLSAIPQGATIVDARITVFGGDWNTGMTSEDFVTVGAEQAEGRGRGTNYTTHNSRASNVGTTVNWMLPNLPQNNMEDISPNLAPVLQEVVNRPGWNGVVNFFCESNSPNGSSGPDPQRHSLATAPDSSYYPSITVTYIEP